MRNRHSLLLAIAFTFALTAGPSLRAESAPPSQVGPGNETGVRPYSPYEGIQETINLTNGNVYIRIPLIKLAGRDGHNVELALEYNSKTWILEGYYDEIGDSYEYYWYSEERWPQVGDLAWRLNLPSLHSGAWVASDQWGSGCEVDFIATLSDGSKHSFRNRANCSGSAPRLTVTDSEDTSYMRLDTSNESDVVLYMKDGTRIHFPALNAMANKIVDTNGNVITLQGDPFKPTTIADTLGRQITITYGTTYPFSPTSITYNDSNGQTATITLGYDGKRLKPVFTEPHAQGLPLKIIYQPPEGYYWLLTSVTLPNNRAYTFDYEETPEGQSNLTFGELSKIIYPAGGYTRYVYDRYVHKWEVQLSDKISTIADFREIKERRRCPEADGVCAQEELTTYTPTVDGGKTHNQYMQVLDPLGNLTKHQFNLGWVGWYARYNAAVELKREICEGQQTLKRTIQTEYNELYGSTPRSWSLPIRVTTTLNDASQVSKVEWTYDTYTAQVIPAGKYSTWSGTQPTTRPIDNPTEEREYHYGSGAAGSLGRKKVNTWLKTNPVNGVDYYEGTGAGGRRLHIMDRKASEYIYDSGGSVKAKTEFEYDSYAESIETSGAVQHDSAWATTYTKRGNLTATKRWRNTDGAWLIIRNNKFDDAGNVLKTTDPSIHQTLFSYADSWGNSACAPVGGNGAAYVTTITNARGHVTTSTYNSCAGTVASTTDPNGRTTYFTYDSLNRLIQTDYPDGGQMVRSFLEATLPIEVQTRTKQDTDPNRDIISTVTLDGLGRVARTRVDTDPEGVVRTQTEYDPYDRKKKVWNPTRCDPPDVNCGESTWGVTEFQYDALGRVTKVIPPDGSSGSNNVTTVYTGNCTEVIDQAGKKRKTCNDALGRLTNVWEPNSGGAYVYETVYQYDVLDNLTQAQQKGNDPNSANWRTRTFGYNSLSQLTSANNPESGTTTYGYDNCGNLTSKTDARSVSITYAYDDLHRLLSKNYSDTPANPDASYSYDGPDCLGAQFCYNTGRRTGMSDGAGTQAWSYDAMGRAIRDRRTTNSVTMEFGYEYYYTSAVHIISYPSGAAVQYDNTGAGRAQWGKDTARNIDYATEAHYAPQGALSSLKNGASGGFNGYTRTYTYNKRLQPDLISASSPGGTIFSLDYDFNLGAANNGNVKQIANTLVPDRTQNFTYDHLNRVATAQTQADTGTYCWGLSFGIDIWANLYTATVTKCNPPGLSVTPNPQNRLNGFGYDAAGNMTSDGGFTYAYDAENRITTTAGVNYTYDGDGQRVKKSNGKLYWYGISAEVLVETDSAGNSPTEYVFFAEKRVARREASGTVYYYFEDHLGTSRVIVQGEQNSPCYDADFYPFGGERVYVDTCAQNYKFTGKERDAETQNDYFMARFYASNLGRFLSADPLMGMQRRPQSLNRYAYMLNNPLRLIDPTGLHPQQGYPSSNQTVGCTQDKAGCNPHQAEAVDESEKVREQQGSGQSEKEKEVEEAGNVVYNETGGLRPTEATGTGSGSAQGLHEARVDVSHVFFNRKDAGKGPGKGIAVERVSAGGKNTDAYMDSQAAARDAATSADRTGGARNFFIAYRDVYPRWSTDMRVVATHGPFMNLSGGGDVPKGDLVVIVILHERKR